MFHFSPILKVKAAATALAAILVTSTAMALSYNNNDPCGVLLVVPGDVDLSIKGFEPMTGDFTAHILNEYVFGCDEGEVSNCRMCVFATLYIWTPGVITWLPVEVSDPEMTELEDCGSTSDTQEFETGFPASLGPYYKVIVFYTDNEGENPCTNIRSTESKEFSYSSP